MSDTDIETITAQLKLDARGLGIPEGAAEVFIKRTLNGAKRSLRGKEIITDKDLTRAIVKELKKYNADFAYVYQNRDTII